MKNEDGTLPDAKGYKLEKLAPLDVRAVWQDEARDFTPWLKKERCIKLIAETIGLEGVELKKEPKSESQVWYSRRRCDIEAELTGDDGATEIIIIENQLEETDFSHLGRIMLYAAQREAKYIVWVVPEVLPDHRKVIAWLNKNTTANVEFYLVKIEVFKLDEARAAPMFTLIEGPDREEKVKTSGTPRQRANYDFWSGFYAFVNEEGNKAVVSCIKSFRQPSRDNWYDVAIGTSAGHIALWNSNNKADISVVVHSKSTFDRLLAAKDEMVGAVGVSAEQVIVNAENVHPVIRFQGPGYQDNDRKKAYQWLLDKLALLTPVIRKTLGVTV